MENSGYCDIITTCGGHAPYMTRLAQKYSAAESCQSNSVCSIGGYTAIDHPGEPNYLSLLSGLAGDCDNRGGAIGGCMYGGDSSTNQNPPSKFSTMGPGKNLVDALETTGLSWKAYSENLAGTTNPCDGGNLYPGSTSAINFPFFYFTDITGNPARCARTIGITATSDQELLGDLNSFGTSNPRFSNFMWVTPNNIDSMRNCNREATCITAEDQNYVLPLVNSILGSRLFSAPNSRAVLFILFESGVSVYPTDNTYTLIAGQNVKRAYIGTGHYSHHSWLHTMEYNWHMPCLQASDCNAATMSEFFTPHPDPPGQYFDNMVTILMENQGYCNIITTCGGHASYLTSLLSQGATPGSSGYTALTHPSEPNYLALFSGLTGPGNAGSSNSNPDCSPSSSCTAGSTLNLVDRLESASLTWQAYAEDLPTTNPCNGTNLYPSFSDVRHFPFFYFTDITQSSARCGKSLHTTGGTDSAPCTSNCDLEVVSALNSASPPNFLWLTPSDCDNMHAINSVCGSTTCGDTTAITNGDNYLHDLVPRILTTTPFQQKASVLFIVFDEGCGTNPSDYVFTIFLGPQAKAGYTGNSPFFGVNVYNHYSWTKTLELNWGLASMTNNDANAPPMAEFLKVNSAVLVTVSNIYDPTFQTAETQVCNDQSPDSVHPYWHPNVHNPNAGCVSISSGTLLATETNSGVGTSGNPDAALAHQGNFPWQGTSEGGTCQSQLNTPYWICPRNYAGLGAKGDIEPETEMKLTATVHLASASLTSGTGYYHLFIGLYFWLFRSYTGTSSAGSLTASYLEAQVRFSDNTNGVLEPAGHTTVWNPSNAFGYSSEAVNSLTNGQSATVNNLDINALFYSAVNAWSLPKTTRGLLVGVEIGNEGYNANINSQMTTVKITTTEPGEINADVDLNKAVNIVDVSTVANLFDVCASSSTWDNNWDWRVEMGNGNAPDACDTILDLSTAAFWFDRAYA